MPPMIGQAIFERMPPNQIRNLLGPGLGGELFYSFVIIVCSLMIYWGTKELYELSSHKGIKYFRQSFLFFAIAYFFRSFIKFVVIYFDITGVLDLSPVTFGATGLITQLLFVYFSAMAVFYLLYSVMWKKWNSGKYKIHMLHALAFVMAIISIISHNPAAYFVLNIFLLAIVIFVVYISSKDKKKRHSLYVIYVLLLVFWILNIIDTLIPRFFEGFQMLLYLISTGIFLLILYKVIKKTGSN